MEGSTGNLNHFSSHQPVNFLWDWENRRLHVGASDLIWFAWFLLHRFRMSQLAMFSASPGESFSKSNESLQKKKKNFSHNSPLSLIAATCFEPTEMWTNFSRVDRFNKVGRLTLELVWLSCPRIPPYEEIYDTIKGEGRPLIDPRYMYSHPPK